MLGCTVRTGGGSAGSAGSSMRASVTSSYSSSSDVTGIDTGV
jgi:hypothetical protein